MLIKKKINTYKLLTKKDDIPHGGYAIVVFYVNVNDEKDTFALKITNVTNMSDSSKNRVLKEIELFKLIEKIKLNIVGEQLILFVKQKKIIKNQYIYIFLKK